MNAFAPVRTADPVNPIVSTADAKAHLKLETTDEDTLVAALVAAAAGYLDGHGGVLGQALITQAWEQSFDGFPESDRLRLPLGPLQQVDGISYFDSAGTEQTFTSFAEATDAIGPLVILNDGASWPDTAVRPDAVTVTWTCGFGDDAADIPAAIAHAAKLLIGDWHLNRENTNIGNITTELPFAVRTLIQPWRKVGV